MRTIQIFMRTAGFLVVCLLFAQCGRGPTTEVQVPGNMADFSDPYGEYFPPGETIAGDEHGNEKPASELTEQEAWEAHITPMNLMPGG